MILHDLLCNRQSDTRTLIVSSMQSLKHTEDFIAILVLESNTVVAELDAHKILNADVQILRFISRDRMLRDRNYRGMIATELKRIADQVLKQLPHLSRNSFDHWQMVDLDRGVLFLDRDLKIFCNALDEF